MEKEEEFAMAAAVAGVAKSALPVVVSGMTLAVGAGCHVDVDSGSEGVVHLVEYHKATPPAGQCTSQRLTPIPYRESNPSP
ncbi:hypothetical protein [Aeromonas aquatica]|uniref:hypothetical protein n=1 Tax=Aeromonas aquatica TaxID=558964 RepID=UPI001EE76420|nr:hypothetical protein [Aeromonas aquatica]